MLIQDILFIISSSFVVLLSYWVAKQTGNEILLKIKKRTLSEIDVSNLYVFRNIGIVSAAISNIGSSVSLYSLIFGGFLMSLGWGSIVFISMLCAVLASALITPTLMILYMNVGHENDYTYFERLDRLSKDKFGYFAIFAIVIITLSAISAIGSEIQALKIFHAAISDETSALLSGKIDPSSFQLNLVLLVICIYYVVRGGYKGVLRTDKIQIAFIIPALIISIAILIKSNSFVSDFIYNLNINTEIIFVGIASFLLIFSWGISVPDSWVRCLGSLRVAGDKNKSKRKTIKAFLLGSLMSFIILFTVGAVGLNVRTLVQDEIFQKTSKTSNSYTSDYLKETQFLYKHEKNILTPSRVENGDSIDSFTIFTNSAYILGALFISDYTKDIGTNVDVIRYVFIALVFFCAIVSIAITTIDSQLLSLAQIMIGYAKNRDKNSRLFATIRQPIYTIILISFLTLFLCPFLNERTYLSFGVFSWACMLFLALISVFSVLNLPDKYVRRMIHCVMFSFVAWLVIIVIPHFAITIVEMNIESHLRYLKPRSAMPIAAFLIIMTTFLFCMVYCLIIKLRKIMGDFI